MTKKYQYYTYDNIQYLTRVESNDREIIKDVNNCKLYDLEKIKLLDGPIIDIGSHIGSFLLKANQYTNKEIIGYELDKENYALSALNCNNINNIKVFNKAVIGDYMPNSYEWDDNNTGSNKLIYDKFGIGKIDDYIHINDILKYFDKISLLKLDVEGSEFPIIESISNYNLKKIDRIFIEFHNDAIEKSGLETIFKDDIDLIQYLKTYFNLEWYDNHVDKKYDMILSHAKFRKI